MDSLAYIYLLLNINPFMPYKRFYSNPLDEYISSRRGVWLFLARLSYAQDEL